MRVTCAFPPAWLRGLHPRNGEYTDYTSLGSTVMSFVVSEGYLCFFLPPHYENLIRDREDTDYASVASSVIRLLQIVRGYVYFSYSLITTTWDCASLASSTPPVSEGLLVLFLLPILLLH